MQGKEIVLVRRFAAAGKKRFVAEHDRCFGIIANLRDLPVL